MAELTQQERLQPSLLDRLIDDAPGERQEGREQRVLSSRRLRECVLRDLHWLFNAVSLAAGEDLEAYPHVAKSVVNYGMPALAGATASSIDVAALEQEFREMLTVFEPRIVSQSLRVRLAVSPDRMAHNSMVFEIEGELWAQPVSQRIFLRTEVDLELGEVRVLDAGGTGPG